MAIGKYAQYGAATSRTLRAAKYMAGSSKFWSSVGRLNVPLAAAGIGAYFIRRAKEKTIKAIESQHSPERMRRHSEQMAAIRSQRRRKAAGNIRNNK